MIYYGIVDNNHDSSLAIFENNNLLFASHSERFSQYKQDPVLSEAMIKHCIRTYGLPDQINYFEKPPVLRTILVDGFDKIRTKKKIKKEFNRLFQKDIPIDFKNHHLTHAATGFYTSGFKEACVVVCDAIGEYDTVSIYKANESGFKRVFNLKYPHSIGLFYSAVTQYLGFKPNRDEYIVMGLASYGKPIYKEYLIDKFIRKYIKDNSYFLSDMFPLIDENSGDIFEKSLLFKHNFHLGIDLSDLSNYPDENIAASAQAVFEWYINKLVHIAKKLVNSDNLVLAGGCALNCVNNTNISNTNLFKNIWINPNPGDAGSAIGSVTLDVGHIDFKNNYLGYEIEPKYQVKEIVDELLKKNPVGVASGRSEFGPRALGNRSLLLDPRVKIGKYIMNNLKKRDPFRPFAPMVLESHANDYFDLVGHNQKYMQFVSNVLVDNLHAIKHVDNTARIQVVPNDDSIANLVLKEWYSKTGCPVLLNTSLNIKNKPMVNDWDQALDFQSKYEVKVFR